MMLNGGFDPVLARGRGVWMLDVYSGETLWKYTDDDLKAAMGAKANMWSVPATVAMTDIGDANQATLDGDGYFDTANWGDLGGTLFVARMKTPGVRGGAGNLVQNWHVGRAFEEQRQASNDQLFAGRTEFFHMSANAIHLRTGVQHTYLGGGNRDQLLQGGAACGPNNVLGCFQAGCKRLGHHQLQLRQLRRHQHHHLHGREDGAQHHRQHLRRPAHLRPRSAPACSSRSPAGPAAALTTATMACDSSGTCSSRNPAATASLFPTKAHHADPAQPLLRALVLRRHPQLRHRGRGVHLRRRPASPTVAYAASCPGPHRQTPAP